MSYFVYIDEAGTEKESRCYSIGAFILNELNQEQLCNVFSRLKKKHPFDGNEIKWSKIHDKTKARINMGLDLFYELFINPFYFHIIVVDKMNYNRWNEDHENAFYITYTELIKYIAQLFNEKLEIYSDERNDKYPKHHEVCQIIANRMLYQCGYSEQIKPISRVDSKMSMGIQYCDFITGSITTAHNAFLKSNYKVNKGKTLCIHQIANMLHWDGLHHDTWKNLKFNIWHFPIEFRGFPPSLNTPAFENISMPNYIKD